MTTKPLGHRHQQQRKNYYNYNINNSYNLSRTSQLICNISHTKISYQVVRVNWTWNRKQQNGGWKIKNMVMMMKMIMMMKKKKKAEEIINSNLPIQFNFTSHFSLDLAQLQILYENEGWASVTSEFKECHKDGYKWIYNQIEYKFLPSFILPAARMKSIPFFLFLPFFFFFIINFSELSWIINNTIQCCLLFLFFTPTKIPTAFILESYDTSFTILQNFTLAFESFSFSFSFSLFLSLWSISLSFGGTKFGVFSLSPPFVS